MTGDPNTEHVARFLSDPDYLGAEVRMSPGAYCSLIERAVRAEAEVARLREADAAVRRAASHTLAVMDRTDDEYQIGRYAEARALLRVLDGRAGRDTDV